MSDAAAFTLRFRDPATHRLLRDVARAQGVSMSELAERLVAEGLRAEAAELERTLESVLAHLRSYRPDPDGEEEARNAATAEIDPAKASVEPLPKRRVTNAEVAEVADLPEGTESLRRPAGRAIGRSASGRTPAERSSKGGKNASRSARNVAAGDSDESQMAQVADMTRRLSAGPPGDLPRRRPARGSGPKS